MTGMHSKRTCAALLTASAMLAPMPGHGQEPAVTLPAVQVEGEAPKDSTRDAYIEKDTATATRTDTPVIEIPQSVTTITREQIDDQNPQTVKDALNYTAGVLSTPDTTSRYDSIFLRGFGGFGTATRIVDFLDGLKLPRGQAFALPSIDPFLLDHIDVLKGPSAVLYGETSPGGLVNQISRMPSATRYNEARVEGGSYTRLQGGATNQGAIDTDGHWQYSISAIGRRSGNLELIGALTLLDTKVTKSTVATNIGKRPQAVPDYYGATWVNYGFDTGLFSGLTLGSGVRFVGSSFADDANTVEADGYVLVDAAVRYDLKKLIPPLRGAELTLNATNLLDKEYYSSCSSSFYCQYGNGRLVLAGLRYKW